MRDLLFYLLGAVLLGLAVSTVMARNLFRSALSLLGVLWCTAVLFIALSAEMVALVQVMVYIGGIMIFVLYAVLLTSELGGKMARPTKVKWISASSIFIAVVTALLGLAMRVPVGDLKAVGNIADLHKLGLRLLDAGPAGFLVPFELISVVLLASMVGAIAIARQDPISPQPPKASQGKHDGDSR